MQQMLTHHAECISKAFTALAWSWIHVVTAAVLLAGALYAQPWIAVGGAALLACFQLLFRPLAARSRAAAAGRAAALGRYVHVIGQALGVLRELRVFHAAQALADRAAAAVRPCPTNASCSARSSRQPCARPKTLISRSP